MNNINLNNNTIKISIVVLTYNRVEVLSNLLYLLSSIISDWVEGIIVDNCSEDGTEEMVKEGFSDFIYIKTDKNIGVGARNLGIEVAKGEVIVCLDDDVYGINEEALRKIYEEFGNDEELGAINFKVIDYYSGEISNWIHHCSADRYSGKKFLTYEITEGAVAFRKKALKRSGLYPENFFLSHEGTDLALRIMDKGFKVIFWGEIIVKHKHSDLGRKKWMNYYYDTRNQFWLAVRNFPIGYMIRYLLKHVAATFIYSLRDGYLRFWFKAVKDGIWGIRGVKGDRNVLNNEIMNMIYLINQNKPPLLTVVRKRLFRKNMRL
jgi:GT2 family glycosyltransferase